MIPIWGSGREAIAEWQEGDYVSALINAGLAASDVFVVGAIRNAITKGLVRKTPTGWKATRKWLEKKGFVRTGDEAHHFGIPQGGWGKAWPTSLRDHPLNIKSLPQDVHRRITGKWGGEPRFNPFEQFWHGTPTWTKVGIGGVGADAVQSLDDRKR